MSKNIRKELIEFYRKFSYSRCHLMKSIEQSLVGMQESDIYLLSFFFLLSFFHCESFSRMRNNISIVYKLKRSFYLLLQNKNRVIPF